MPREVEVVAHRGSSAAVAEHTLSAYRAAIAEGADAVECDVRLTRDGVLVCVHDRRVDRTSDGRGAISALELADLAELDFASWKSGHSWRGGASTGAASQEGGAAPGGGAASVGGDPWAGGEEPDSDAGRVLTLERLLQLVLSADRRVQLHIETKHPTRYGGLVEHTLVELLERYGLAEPPPGQPSQVTVMSFAASSLRRVHAYAPQLPTVFLMRRLPTRYWDGSLPSRVGTAGPKLALLKANPGYVERVHAQGGKVHVWTVDDPHDVDLVLSLGVDAVISNQPTCVLRKLDRV